MLPPRHRCTAVYLHRLPKLLLLMGGDPSLLNDHLLHCGLAALVLAAPGLALWGAHTAAIRGSSGRRRSKRAGGAVAALSSGSWSEAATGGAAGNGAGMGARFTKIAYRLAAHRSEATTTGLGHHPVPRRSPTPPANKPSVAPPPPPPPPRSA